jgi:hypothetical protein
MTSDPKLGDVWRYPFLWSAEAVRGETEGRKQRPTALTLFTRKIDGETIAIFVPLTTKDPGTHAFGIEIPEIEKRRAGLDSSKRVWVITDEANSDVLSRSFYFEPEGRVGSFSPMFLKLVQAKMIEAIKSRKLRSVQRWEPSAD